VATKGAFLESRPLLIRRRPIGKRSMQKSLEKVIGLAESFDADSS